MHGTMNRTTLVLPPSILEAFIAALAHPLETAGVLLVRVVELPGGGRRLLAREYLPVPDAAYLRRDDDRLTIASDGYVPALARAEALGAAPLWVHTHPGLDASPRPSRHDAVVDRELAEPFRLRSGSRYYGALVLSPRASGLAFTGHLDELDGAPVPIERLWLPGERFQLVPAVDTPAAMPLAMFDRNVRAFGPAIQSTLGDLTVAVIGNGGTGSAVVEQLVRLGFRDLLLIDPDVLSASNVTRVYGSTPADEGRPKVEVLAEHAARIAPDGRFHAVRAAITDARTARLLAGVDLVFGCTDDNAGRLVLSRLPTYLLTPVIDCGVLLSSADGGRITGVDGRVTVVTPEGACLLCRGRIDVVRAGAELLSPEERQRRADEGYAPALGGVEPAVVAFTTLVAAAAVSEVLERLIGYGPDPRPGEVLLRWHEREVSTNLAKSRPGHYCDPAAGKLGAGDADPFLELAWTT